MSYGILLCGHAAVIDKIFVLQKQAVRTIYRLAPRRAGGRAEAPPPAAVCARADLAPFNYATSPAGDLIAVNAGDR
ncbi:hypothetical protein EVAR_74559_1 [Eumeta japonica]|uniref:Uncharacterized protein n=1 Tax=Eumeta variegata TaxID=151549 RepID=A0A4C1TCL4_EUMVA|nr:hypothetical protein EVAR_74559_1 [Eumeta japonica]